MPSTEVPLRVMRLAHGEGLPLPAYATAGAAGMDVVSAEDVTLAPLARHAVATGLALAIPAGFEIQVRPRSGLALKHGITVANAPGTVDSDYRGELKVILVNLGAEDFVIRRGDRVAQIVLAPVVRGGWVEVAALDETVRGAGGFGSTGGSAALEHFQDARNRASARKMRPQKVERVSAPGGNAREVVR